MRLKGFTLLLCSLFLVACEEQVLYGELSEREANEMVAVLYAADLPAQKSSDKDRLFTISTSKDAFPGAMALLHAQGLPREQFESLGEVFQKEGFVSSPLEERARLNHALSQEISHTISSIDGVVMARVHLAVPEKQQLVKGTQPSSASVFVKHRPDVDLSVNIGKIKAMVINSVEGLPYDNVTVALFPQEPYKLPTRHDLQVGDQPEMYRASMLTGPALMVIAGLLLIGVMMWRLHRLSVQNRQP